MGDSQQPKSPPSSSAPPAHSSSDPNLAVSGLPNDDDHLELYEQRRRRKQPDDSFNFTADLLTEKLNKAIAQLGSDLNARFDQLSVNMTTEMNKFQEYAKTLKDDIAAVNLTCTALNSSISNLDTKQKQCLTQIAAVGDKIKSHDDRISKLENNNKQHSEAFTKIKELSESVQYLRGQLSMNSQRNRLKNLEVSGVPFIKGENLFTILNTLSVKIGVTVIPSDIDEIHRVRRFATEQGSELVPNIIIHFINRRKKDDFLAACRARRDITTSDLGFNGPSKPVFINEHLTPQNKTLLKNARDLKKSLGYQFVWVKDGKIFLRKSETSKIIHVSNETDLNKIK
ncbi:hypothetical protein NE865_03837 [Phthorimaea operculella]|nr:hypothetical protein NE865_03837 [Phthorimaea operculella]